MSDSSTPSSPKSDRSVDSDAANRAGMKRWLETWKHAGPILEEERRARLRAMSEDEANQTVRWLLELWQPDWRGDDGEGLILQQRVFARARRPASP